MLKERDLALNMLKENLNVAHNRMKKMADTKRRELKFKVGDEVYLKLRPYRQRSLARKRCEKLAPKFYGPYKMNQQFPTSHLEDKVNLEPRYCKAPNYSHIYEEW